MDTPSQTPAGRLPDAFICIAAGAAFVALALSFNGLVYLAWRFL
jgi:hypothetical protein